jgi:hypothetical protein
MTERERIGKAHGDAGCEQGADDATFVATARLDTDRRRCLLEEDGLIDRAILYGFELRVTKTPGHPVVPRFAQRGLNTCPPLYTTTNVSRRGRHAVGLPSRQRSWAASEALGQLPSALHRAVHEQLLA